MEQKTRVQLENAGWVVGSASDFLELTPEEEMLINIRLALYGALQERMVLSDDTMIEGDELAANSGEAQSIDQLIREILATGASPQDIGQVIASVR